MILLRTQGIIFSVEELKMCNQECPYYRQVGTTNYCDSQRVRQVFIDNYSEAVARRTHSMLSEDRILAEIARFRTLTETVVGFNNPQMSNFQGCEFTG